MGERCIKSEAEASEAIAAVVEWLNTNPQGFDYEGKLRDWAHALLDERVDDMCGCPLCQS